MPGNVIRAALLTIAILATNPDNAHAKSPSDRVQALFEAGQKSEDSSYTAALTSYEALNRLLLDLDTQERDYLAFVTTFGIPISGIAFVDSFIPLARRRALAESDIFECVFWIGSQFPPDTCYDPLTGETKGPFRCPPPPNSSFRYFEEVFSLCRDGNREDLARRIDFAFFPSLDTAVVYSDLVGMACRAGDHARAATLLDTVIQFIEGTGLCRSRYFVPELERVFDKYAFLLAQDRQVDLLNRYAICVDTIEANALWYPFGFLARHYFRLSEFLKAESCAVKAAQHWMPNGLHELAAFYSQYRSIGDSIAAERILNTALSLMGYVPGGSDYMDEEFLIHALSENGRVDEANQLFDNFEQFQLSSLAKQTQYMGLPPLVEHYVHFNKRERGEFVLDSLGEGVTDQTNDYDLAVAVIRGYCTMKLYANAERFLRRLGRTPIASKCALAAIQWIHDDPYYFQPSMFIQFIADTPTRDSAWLSMIKPDEGDYGFQLAAERCRNIVSDEIRLAAITKLAPDIWMGTHDVDIEAEANELCTKVGNLNLAYEWYIRMFKGSNRYYEMAKARFYLTKREEFLRVNQNAQGFTVFSEYYLDLAEDYASCSLFDKAKELIAEYVLPQADDDMLRARIVTAYGNIGATDLALKIVAEMDDPYDRGQALANVACLARSTSVNLDRECRGYLHTIIQTTVNDLKK